MIGEPSASPLTPGRCRRARDGLGWTVADLAGAAGMREVDVARFEAGLRGLGREALGALRDALVAGGTGSPSCPTPVVVVAAPGPDPPITPGQCRRARELLGWSLHRLAREAALRITTVGRFERGSHRPREGEVPAMRRALEADGVRLRERRAGR